MTSRRCASGCTPSACRPTWTRPRRRPGGAGCRAAGCLGGNSKSFQTEITKLDQRRGEIEQKRLETSERLRVAPEHDARILAQWQRDSQPGSRPEPSGPQLENELKQLEEDERALIHAADSVAAERATFVQRNRSRLVADAAKAEEKALERAQRALGELEEAREALVQSRRVAIWSQLYPSQAVGQEPIWQQLAGGLRRALAPLGVQQSVALEAVLNALREDLNWLSTAASPVQRAELPDARPLTQEERERARDRQLEDAGSLHRQAAQDQRTGELERLRKRL